MTPQIRKITEDDRASVLSMMDDFYSSPAVSTDGSEEIFNADIDACLSDSPFLEGYVFDLEGTLQGYAMLAHSFSTEYGRNCIWIEDLYIIREHRGKGIGGHFIEFVKDNYPNTLIRLEVEEENETAVHTYKKAGFDFFPYLEMKTEA
ncbi:MAG: GNAT family N-acetyltransferase [Clostridia bacterium]|nr:GNAT family N-acetyltransferase [Clostridia bacterium]